MTIQPHTGVLKEETLYQAVNVSISTVNSGILT